MASPLLSEILADKRRRPLGALLAIAGILIVLLLLLSIERNTWGLRSFSS